MRPPGPTRGRMAALPGWPRPGEFDQGPPDRRVREGGRHLPERVMPLESPRRPRPAPRRTTEAPPSTRRPAMSPRRGRDVRRRHASLPWSAGPNASGEAAPARSTRARLRRRRAGRTSRTSRRRSRSAGRDRVVRRLGDQPPRRACRRLGLEHHRQVHLDGWPSESYAMKVVRGLTSSPRPAGRQEWLAITIP